MHSKAVYVKHFLLIMLTVVMTLTVVGCTSNSDDAQTSVSNVLIQTDGEVLGTGIRIFELTVVDRDGKEIHAEIHTDKETVGEALEELGIIAGEESPTGIYIKTVNGITADYDVDSTYWAFYVNGAYAQTGVGSTPITEGDHYALKVEQG